MGSFGHLGITAHTVVQEASNELVCCTRAGNILDYGYGEFGPYVNDGWELKFGL